MRKRAWGNVLRAVRPRPGRRRAASISAAAGMASALTIAAVGVTLYGGLATAAPTTTISVDFTRPIASSPAENFGFTFSTFGVEGGPTPNSPADIASLRNLNAGVIRLHLKPDANGNIVSGADGGDHTITGDRWIDVIEEIGAEPVVIVNLDQADALAVLNYLNANGHTVKKYILGNEFDANSKSNVSAAEYVVRFRQIASAMRAVTPGLEIGGPAPADYSTGTLQTFIDGTIRNVSAQEKASFIDYHAYGSGAGQNATIAASTKYVAQLQQLRTMVNDPSVRLQLGEFNMNWGDESQNNTHFASVWVANAFGSIISQGATALLYADKNNAMGLVATGGAPKASYIGMAMFTGQPGGLRHFGRQVVQSSSSDAAVYVYASTDSENIVVVNTGSDTSATFNLTGVTGGTADVWQSAGTISAIHSPAKVGTAQISGATFTAALPAMSITTFVLTLSGPVPSPSPSVSPTPGPVTLPGFDNAKWAKQGTGATTAATATLTTADQRFSAGSVYYTDAVPSAGLSASFDATIGGGTGGDGMAMALLDPASTARLGANGGGLGYSGLSGVAVTLDTFNNSTNALGDLVGIATGGTGSTFNYVASTASVPALRSTHRYDVAVLGGVLTIKIDGVERLRGQVSLPSNVVIAFTAGTGSSADLHRVSNAVITVGGGAVTPTPTPTATPTPTPSPTPSPTPTATPTPSPSPTATALPGLADSGWQVRGSATKTAQAATLTAAGQQFVAGSLVYATAKPSDGIEVAFDVYLGGGTGGDGQTLVFIDPSSTARIGAAGGGLGYTGLTGTALTFDTHQNGNDPSGSFVGVATGGSGDTLTYAATANVTGLRNATRHVVAQLSGGRLVVRLDGATVLDVAVSLPPTVLIGFTAGAGGDTDNHLVSNVVVTTR